MSATMDKIAALLALAERTDNEHEAELAMQQAQRLATLNAVDLAVARQHTAKKEKREEIESRPFRIGAKGAKGNKQLIELYLAIADENNVQYLIAHNNTYVYPMGFPSDLDVVEAMYTSLAVQMTVAANAYLKKGDYKKETVTREVRTYNRYWSMWEYEQVEKPLDGRQARAEFNRGFTRKIGQRLADARIAAEKEAASITLTVDDEETGEITESTGALVLASKKTKVREAHQARVKREKIRGAWKGSRASGTSVSSRMAGSEAGSTAKLRGTTSIGGGRQEVSS